ncbi:MAG TPA: FGGY-family carbohydrate kinase [Candidatus Limnocylindrales bacterium]
MAPTPLSALLAIDLGTSTIKVVAFDVTGQLLVMRREATPTTRLSEGRAEHDVDALWSIVARLIAQVVADLPNHRVETVGVASVGETGVALDRNGRSVRPAIAWFDSRGEAEAEWWANEAGASLVGRISGQPIDAHYGVNRLLWLRHHEADEFARIRHWLSLADFVILRLCGVYGTDFTLASRTMVFDQRNLNWSRELLDMAGLDQALFPQAFASGTQMGTVTRAAANATGLVMGTPIVTGGHDRLCAAYASRGSDLLPVDSTGSAEALVMPIGPYVERDPSELGYAACYADVVPGQYVISARVGYAGALIDWYRRLAAPAAADSEPFSVDTVVDWPLSFSGLLCYPSFGRVVAPNWDPSTAGGTIIGLTIAHKGADIVQALVEGVGYALRANVEWLEQVIHAPVPTIRVEGPMTGSRVWMQLKADVTGRQIEGVRIVEATALGAALLAGVGAGVFPDHNAATATVKRELDSWTPTPELAAVYGAVFRDGFQRLPKAVSDIARLVRGEGSN